MRQVLRNFHVAAGSRVLEPSAGTGNMVRPLLQEGARVTAVEIELSRVHALEAVAQADDNLTVVHANFLRFPTDPTYDAVVMNPPFFGTHWMEHVLHAFDFLAPGGTLVAVLPVTAELGDSRKHRTFRAWADEHTPYGVPFRDLPAESFAESGTRINTVILTLRKSRR